MIVVSDSGPLISLMKGEQLEVLHALYGEVLIPEAVFVFHHKLENYYNDV